MTDLVWHYTTGECFKSIVDTGAILPATVGIVSGERPIVWFSAEPFWEPTANKRVREADGTIRHGDFEDTLTLGGGLVRFGVTRVVARHDWKALKRKSRMPPAHARGLETSAREVGADPAKWFGSFQRVTREQWSAIEVYQDGAWVAVPLERAP